MKRKKLYKKFTILTKYVQNKRETREKFLYLIQNYGE